MGQCQFFVERKRRFCKMRAKEGSQYCGEHLTSVATVGEGDEERIPCPLDPNHSVFKKDLEKHLKKCNARPGPVPPYFSLDINVLNKDEEVDEEDSLIKLNELSKEDYVSLVNRVRQERERLKLPVIVEADVGVECTVNDTVKEQLQKEAMAKLILAPDQDYTSKKTAFVEMGCGKGGLSHHLISEHAVKLKSCQFFLVDRENFRRKLDRRAGEIEDTIEVHRIKMDIKDLCLDRLLDRDVKQVVIISKHLCGAATCLTLAALRNLILARPELEIRLFVALCCHQLCNRQAYVGSLDLGKQDFAHLCSMSSWAVCGWKYNSEGKEEEHASGYTRTDCNRIGLECKQLLNEGRLVFLTSLGLNSARIVPYIERTTTLENLMMII